MKDSYLVRANLVDSKEKGGDLPDRNIKVAIDVEEVKKLIGGITPTPTPTPEPEATHIKVSGGYSSYNWLGIYDRDDIRAHVDGNLSFYSTDVMWEKDDGTKLSNLDVYRAMQNGEKFALDFSLAGVTDYIQTPEAAGFSFYCPPSSSPDRLIVPGVALVRRTGTGEVDPNGDGQFSAVYGAYYGYGATTLTMGFSFHIDNGQETVKFFATMPGNFDAS